MTAAADRKREKAVRERVSNAFLAFNALLEAGLQPSLTSTIQTDSHWRDGEYDVVIEGVGYGVLHEELKQALAIAEAHGGQLFLTPKETREQRELAILFPVNDPPGPGGPEEMSPAEKTGRQARKGSRS